MSAKVGLLDEHCSEHGFGLCPQLLATGAFVVQQRRAKPSDLSSLKVPRLLTICS